MAPPISRKWKAVAEYARRHSGEWCLVSDDQPAGQVQHVRTARLRAFQPAGSFEAMMRGGNGLRGPLLIRHIPPKESE